MAQINIIILSVLGGILPAFFWLSFWLKEDRLKPEPKSALVSAFFGGIMAVFFALFLQIIIYYLFAKADPDLKDSLPLVFWNFLEFLTDKYRLFDWQNSFWLPIQNFIDNLKIFSQNHVDARKIFSIVLIAPLTEEIVKLFLTYNICLRRKVNDEPIDASIYMLTTALGFAAIETALILAIPLGNGDIDVYIASSNSRAFGAMLIHLISSATIGLFIGLAFYKSRLQKFIYLISGLVLAVIIHAIFNFFMILNEATGTVSFFWIATAETWILLIILLVFFNQIKKVRRPIDNRLGKSKLGMV